MAAARIRSLKHRETLLIPSKLQIIWEFPGKDYLVLVRRDIEGLYLLNSTSALIWRSLQEGASCEVIAEQFVSRFGIPFSAAFADVGAMLAAWSDLLRGSRATVPPPSTSPTAHPNSTFSIVRDYKLNTSIVRLIIADQEAAEEITPRLQGLRVAHSSTPDFTFHVFRERNLVWVSRDGVPLAGEPHVNAIRTILLQEIARLSYSGQDFLAVLHAGACGTESACVVLAAPTNSGKTTLTAALMNSGLHFLSDDMTAIDRTTMRIVPMPFALMVREGSWSVLRSTSPELDAAPILQRSGHKIRYLHPKAYSPSLNPLARHLVFNRFQPGSSTSLERITDFECLAHLKESGFWVAHDKESISLFLNWVQSVPSYRLTYSDLSGAVSEIHKLLGVSSQFQVQICRNQD